MIDSGGAAMPGLRIWGIASWCQGRYEGVLTPNGATWVASDPSEAGNASTALPNTVGATTLDLGWSLFNDTTQHVGLGWLGSSRTRAYRVAATPRQTPLYEALLSISTAAANGITGDNQQELVDRIWAPFAARNVRRADGTQLGYYRGVLCASDLPLFRGRELLEAGNGQCGSWANLFRMILLAHGVQGSEHVFLFPKENTPIGCIFSNGQWSPRPAIEGIPSGALGFIVKSNQFGNPGSVCIDYPYRFNDPCQVYTQWPVVDVVDAAGVVGQDSPNPASWFTNHQIVRILGKLYDPSYGIGPFQSVAQYESAAIDGYYGVANCIFTPGGQVTAIYLGVVGESATTDALADEGFDDNPE